jgi:hypothetical protein
MRRLTKSLRHGFHDRGVTLRAVAAPSTSLPCRVEPEAERVPSRSGSAFAGTYSANVTHSVHGCRSVCCVLVGGR